METACEECIMKLEGVIWCSVYYSKPKFVCLKGKAKK